MKLSHPFHIVTGPLNDLHIAIGIDDVQYMFHKAWRHWGEANIRKGTPIFNHLVCDVHTLKTYRCLETDRKPSLPWHSFKLFGLALHQLLENIVALCGPCVRLVCIVGEAHTMGNLGKPPTTTGYIVSYMNKVAGSNCSLGHLFTFHISISLSRPSYPQGPPL